MGQTLMSRMLIHENQIPIRGNGNNVCVKDLSHRSAERKRGVKMLWDRLGRTRSRRKTGLLLSKARSIGSEWRCLWHT
ncbi:hypothetical protein AA0229_0171 [Gluconobacter cerinus NRIC 0229]|nr:hypothetical protein AA0229_0171 [Gluconobacter cerinus NRIC 0229]